MGKRTKEYYISIDVEADGPCPGINSMLQFGAVFYNPEGNIILNYCANILPLEGAVQNPETMTWWSELEDKHPVLWDRMMKDRVTPKLAMERFQSYVQVHSRELKASPLVIAYPSSFDFTFLYWYLCKFLGQSCVGFSSLDIKTLAMAILGESYHDSAKKRFPKEWFDPKLKHTHNALDDALEQGHIFFKMMEELQWRINRPLWACT
jgi:DNA polymerase III alpha subunit (gram-positive type)